MLPDLTESPAAAAAYAALAEFERLAALPALAPSLADRMAVAEVIAQRHERYRELLGRLGPVDELEPGMTAAAPPIDDARRRVESADWWEALTAAALCAALTDELFDALAGAQLDAPAATDTSQVWATERLRTALAEDSVLAARIAMWCRRLVGEAIVLAREFAGERYPELADRLAASHARRLTDLGLSS